jgi:excisionase family DNA binding protein
MASAAILVTVKPDDACPMLGKPSEVVPRKMKIGGESAMRQRQGVVRPTQDYLGVQEAGAMTGTSPWFWRRKAYDGTVGSVKLGRRLLIPRAEIDRFIRESTRPRVKPKEGNEAPADKPTVQ